MLLWRTHIRRELANCSVRGDLKNRPAAFEGALGALGAPRAHEPLAKGGEKPPNANPVPTPAELTDLALLPIGISAITSRPATRAADRQ